MTQETSAAELRSLRERVERTKQNIDQISRNLSAETQSLQQMIEQYNAKHIEFFKQELKKRGMSWCTRCSKAIPASQAELMMIEGREEYSSGYGNSEYGFHAFSKMHRVCPACREQFADRHGWKSAYDSQAKDQASFYAFRVEKREDGYYVRKFGNWEKLNEENCQINEPSDQLIKKLVPKLDLPPKIEN